MTADGVIWILSTVQSILTDGVTMYTVTHTVLGGNFLDTSMQKHWRCLWSFSSRLSNQLDSVPATSTYLSLRGITDCSIPSLQDMLVKSGCFLASVVLKVFAVPKESLLVLHMRTSEGIVFYLLAVWFTRALKHIWYLGFQIAMDTWQWTWVDLDDLISIHSWPCIFSSVLRFSIVRKHHIYFWSWCTAVTGIVFRLYCCDSGCGERLSYPCASVDANALSAIRKTLGRAYFGYLDIFGSRQRPRIHELSIESSSWARNLALVRVTFVSYLYTFGPPVCYISV